MNKHPELGQSRVRYSLKRTFSIIFWYLLISTSFGQGTEEIVDHVSCLAVSPDGNHYAIGTVTEFAFRGAVHLGNTSTGDGICLQETDPVLDACFSPDSRLVATGHAGQLPGYGLVRLWDVGTGKLVRTLYGAKGAVTAVRFSADGRSIIAAARRLTADEESRGEMIVWEAETGERRLRVSENDGEILALVPTLDGKTVITAVALDELASQIRLRDSASGAIKQKLQKVTGPVLSLSVSPDGQSLTFSTPRDGFPAGFNAATGHLRFGGQVWAGGRVYLMDLLTRKVQWKIDTFRGRVDSLCFSPDGKSIAASEHIQQWRSTPFLNRAVVVDNAWVVLDRSSGRVERRNHSPSPILGLGFLSRTNSLLTCGSDDVIRFWDAATGQLRRVAAKRSKLHTAATFRPSVIDAGRVVALDFSRDGRKLASLRSDGTVQIWDNRTGEELHRARWIIAGGPGHLAISPDGGRLACSGSSPDDRIGIWSPPGDFQRLGDDQAAASELVFLQSGKLAVRYPDGRTRVWDLSTRTSTPYLGDSMQGRGRFSSDGRYFALAGGGALRLLDVEGHQLDLDKALSQPTAMAFQAGSPDHFAAGDETGTVMLWKTSTKELRQLLDIGRGPIKQLAISCDGGMVAAMHQDRLSVLDVATGKPKWDKRGAEPTVLQFAPDSSVLAAGQLNNAILLFDAHDGSILNLLRR